MTTLRFPIATGLLALTLAFPAVAQKKGGGGGGTPPPAPTPDIVFCYGKATSGTQPLWVMSADGSNARQVLGENCKNAYPTLSPDGQQIAFTKTRGGVSALWVVNVDGTGLHAVTPSLLKATQPSTPIRAVWSPAPAPDQLPKLLFADWPASSTVPQLFVVNLDGSGRTQLTAEPAGVMPTCSYEWSGDATRIAYATRDSMYSPLVVADLGVSAGQLAIVGQTLVPQPPGQAGTWAIGWANTADQLVLAAQRPMAEGANQNLWRIDLWDPQNPVRLTDTANQEMVPTFSGDDSRVLFWNYTGGTWTLTANGGTEVLVNVKAQTPYHRRG